MANGTKQPIVFISYSHLDEPDPLLKPGSEQWLSYVRSHLAPATAHGELELWDDRRIDGGGNWRTDIEDALNRCAVCVFLVSRHSLSSRFILDVEMKRMLERHYAGGAHLYPIVITSVDLGAAPWLLKLNLKPTNATSLELYDIGPRNKVMSELAAEIRQIIERTAADAATEQQIRRLQDRQETTESRLRTIQVVIKALVTEFEYEKLRSLAGDGPFMVQFHNSMISELNRLDAIRYVRPKPGYGIESIRDRDGTDKAFNLKQYAEITSDGLEYLNLRRELLRTTQQENAADRQPPV
jgi:TIR domain